MGELLDYGRPESRAKPVELIAMVVGIVSGPVGYGLARLFDDFTLSFTLLLVALLGALVFGIVARVHAARHPSSSRRLMADLAIAAPVAWVVLPIALMFYL